ncbi:MAG: AzlC family ABC transporter permease [Desulfovibrionaceae bacterium]|jgi:4-azaleucine resistance transporter AzlC
MAGAGRMLPEALAQVWPMALGYVPVGMAYGVLAGKAGLSAVNILAMSLLVYAGSAQLVAVGLFASGASAASLVATTLVVNVRHALFAAALSPFLSGWRKRGLAAFALALRTRGLFGPVALGMVVVAAARYYAGP